MCVELKGVDSEHFWYGDVMIDINQIRYNIQTVDWNTARNHCVASALRHLKNAAECLAGTVNATTNVRVVKSALYALWQVGIPTGVIFNE
jgi:hypothetical protein